MIKAKLLLVLEKMRILKLSENKLKIQSIFNVIIIFSLLWNNEIYSQNINSYGESKPVIVTGKSANISVNQNIYSNSEFKGIQKRRINLDSLISDKEILIQKAKNDKLSVDYIIKFTKEKTEYEIERDSLSKKENEIRKDFINSNELSETLSILEKQDKLYQSLLKKYPYGFRIFVTGKNASIPVKNKFESDMDIEVDWDNSNIIIEGNFISVKLFRWKHISSNNSVTGSTFKREIPKIGQQVPASGIYMGNAPNPFLELLNVDNIKNVRTLVIGFK